MTPLRPVAVLFLVLLLGGGCGRAGPPVRAARAPAGGAAVQATEPVTDQTEDEKEKESK